MQNKNYVTFELVDAQIIYCLVLIFKKNVKSYKT